MNNDEKQRILIVDNDPSILDLLRSILRPTYTVTSSTSGHAALQKAKASLPDLIILDIHLPDIDGFDVLSELKASDITRSIPVICMTRSEDVEHEERSFMLGAADSISKPFHSSTIRARVKTQLQLVRQIQTIEQQVMIDSLTSIPNRRGFITQIDTEWKRAIRDQSPIGLLMIDVDLFKKYNDAYGHPQGDILLQTIAAIFREALKRPADFVARWGGEEFVVLLPNTDLAGALEIAEQIRSRVEHHSIPLSDGTQSFTTISIGVQAVIPSVDSPVASFVSQADTALYKAKKTGRNRVCT